MRRTWANARTCDWCSRISSSTSRRASVGPHSRSSRSRRSGAMAWRRTSVWASTRGSAKRVRPGFAAARLSVGMKAQRSPTFSASRSSASPSGCDAARASVSARAIRAPRVKVESSTTSPSSRRRSPVSSSTRFQWSRASSSRVTRSSSKRSAGLRRRTSSRMLFGSHPRSTGSANEMDGDPASRTTPSAKPSSDALRSKRRNCFPHSSMAG